MTTMTDETETRPRPPSGPPPARGPTQAEGWFGRPAAFLLTAVLLFALYGWTFIANPDRVAPTKDPAYYTWRTEVLISEDPVTLLEIEGAFGMFAGGYRVTAPILGGFLRQIPGISSLNVTVLMMVALPVLTALLLATFAYRHRRDPLIWHSVAWGSASLFLTPPFVGYLDNMLCLFWLAAALPFISRTRNSWPARIAFTAFMLLAGLTHPTTLAIFCLTLGLMAAVRLVFRRFDIKSVLREDGWMLACGVAAAVLTLAIWTVGVWGKSASLSEAVLPPPYGSDFFIDRMVLWVKAMRPILNGPLFIIGVVGLVLAGRRAAEEELTRVSILWLAPLAGLFGFIGGLTYPYYRFFNTTLAWVLLVGIGVYFAARFFIDRARGDGPARLALLGVVALAVVIGTNFTTGFRLSGWNKTDGGWLSSDQRRDLDALRATLGSESEDRPVVFIIDDEPPEPFQIWGYTKLSGNQSRYGLPPGQIDQGFMYLGSLENFIADEATTRDEVTYDKLSPALLEDANNGIEAAGQDPIIVVASTFNQKGANAELAAASSDDHEIWVVTDGQVRVGDATSEPPSESNGFDFLHLSRAIAGLALLMLPGLLALRYFLPGADLADALGLVPAIAGALLIFSGLVVLSIVRSPFSATLAVVSLILSLLVSGWAFTRPPAEARPSR
jgi:hypothetical protein